MKIVVDRKWKRPNYTISNLFIDGVKFCNVLEDPDRGLTDKMSLEEIKRIKIKGNTCIPSGEYEVTINVVSPKFGSRAFYKETCNGRVPRLLNVKGFDGILIHVGDGPNGHRLTEGCLLVGNNTIVGGLTEGKKYFKLLYNKMKEAKSGGEKITILINK